MARPHCLVLAPATLLLLALLPFAAAAENDITGPQCQWLASDGGPNACTLSPGEGCLGRAHGRRHACRHAAACARSPCGALGPCMSGACGFMMPHAPLCVRACMLHMHARCVFLHACCMRTPYTEPYACNDTHTCHPPPCAVYMVAKLVTHIPNAFAKLMIQYAADEIKCPTITGEAACNADASCRFANQPWEVRMRRGRQVPPVCHLTSGPARARTVFADTRSRVVALGHWCAVHVRCCAPEATQNHPAACTCPPTPSPTPASPRTSTTRRQATSWFAPARSWPLSCPAYKCVRGMQDGGPADGLGGMQSGCMLQHHVLCLPWPCHACLLQACYAVLENVLLAEKCMQP